jgi:demethylmenaquinone methyltransferase / 2-methoxy-6-polyprenyl-1,4-benzoquinol methylase
VSENRSAENEHAGRVREMFATIAARYDLLNHLLSGNTDKKWRRIVASRVRDKLASDTSDAKQILDVACGTGDLALTLFETSGVRVVATDFCRPMLQIAAEKVPRQIKLIEGDALSLPFLDRSFEGATIAFGLRNLASVERGLNELFRILRPQGWLAVLEFSRPSNPLFRALFGLYFTKVLPLLGGVISGSKSAYSYLPDSVQRFPDQRELSLLMERAGFDEVTYENLTGGIAALHMARRP